MILRTLDHVSDFSSLRIAYTRLIGTIEDRRKDLMEQYYFFCDCIKCNDIESDRLKTSLICLHSECRGCVPGLLIQLHTVWKLRKFTHTINFQCIMEFALIVIDKRLKRG